MGGEISYKDRFNMTPYERGGEAYSKGVSCYDNPYDIESVEYYQWHRGWGGSYSESWDTYTMCEASND